MMRSRVTENLSSGRNVDGAEADHLRQHGNEPTDSGVLDDPVAGLQGQ